MNAEYFDYDPDWLLRKPEEHDSFIVPEQKPERKESNKKKHKANKPNRVKPDWKK